MAPSTKAAALSTSANSSTGIGVITDTSTPGGVAVNKKKQKRRQKQAARQAGAQQLQSSANNFAINQSSFTNGHPAQTLSEPNKDSRALPSSLDYDASGYVDSDSYNPNGDPNFVDSDEDGQSPYVPTSHNLNGALASYGDNENSAKRKNRKKKKSKQLDHTYDNTADPSAHYPPSALANLPPPPPPPPPPLPQSNGGQTSQSKSKDPIWNTSTYEERGRIKEFWLSLGEEERKSLVKIEKEAVLKKMKEQQKHSCSCTVCGRKRTAIEEELEVLYDAYYDELEQFANQQGTGSETRRELKASPTRFEHQNAKFAHDRPPPLDSQHRTQRGRIHELPEEDEEEIGDDEVDDEEYSEEYDEDDEYSGDDTDDIAPVQPTDFFNFGNSLTVKGGILTVADDLLKNDGKKFIDMMEQLAERRMQREEEAQFPSYSAHSSLPSGHGHVGPSHGPSEDDDYDDEEEDYDDDSQDEDFDDEDEVDDMTESQRMEEGRRMFQIFAARMFEQRVLTAYREKVARERQDKLIQELEEESRADTQRDAKKAREAEKRKQKKQQQKQAKAEEKARKEEQKAAQEAAVREAEEKKQEEQRRKREEARKKKDAERKAQEEERLKKEAERTKRQQEERDRQQEIERKAREQKADEKRRRDEAKRKEREEREAREKDERERKALEEKTKRAEDDRLKAEQEAKERKRREEQALEIAESSKRTALPAIVAVPPVLKSRQTGVGSPSPQAKIATPVISKAPTPTPVRSLQTSTPGSQGSPPQTPQIISRSRQSTSPRAPSGSQSALSSAPPTRTPSQQFQSAQAPPMSPMHQTMPPPGMPPGGSFGGMQAPALNAFPELQGQMLTGMMPRQMAGQQSPTFVSYGPHMPSQQRSFMQPQTLGPQLGINLPGTQGFGRGYTPELAPGFQYPPTSSVSSNIQQQHATSREQTASHSRQHSLHFDQTQADAPDLAPTQPIARPAPIKRPTSPRAGEGNRDNRRGDDVDELSKHLGSASLLADAVDDGPIPHGRNDHPRRVSAAPAVPSQINTSIPAPFFDPSQTPFSAGGRSNVGDAWRSPMSQYGSVGMTSPTSGWGNAPGAGWSNPSAFGSQRNMPRLNLQQIRYLTCSACKQLNGRTSALADDFHDIHEVVRQVNATKAPEQPVTADDIRLILDTEGDAQNGGGYFTTRGDARGGQSIRWEPDAGIPRANRSGLGGGLLGEIGSPVAGNSLPPLSGLGTRPF